MMAGTSFSKRSLVFVACLVGASFVFIATAERTSHATFDINGAAASCNPTNTTDDVTLWSGGYYRNEAASSVIIYCAPNTDEDITFSDYGARDVDNVSLYVYDGNNNASTYVWGQIGYIDLTSSTTWGSCSIVNASDSPTTGNHEILWSGLDSGGGCFDTVNADGAAVWMYVSLPANDGGVYSKLFGWGLNDTD